MKRREFLKFAAVGAAVASFPALAATSSAVRAGQRHISDMSWASVAPDAKFQYAVVYLPPRHSMSESGANMLAAYYLGE